MGQREKNGAVRTHIQYPLASAIIGVRVVVKHAFLSAILYFLSGNVEQPYSSTHILVRYDSKMTTCELVSKKGCCLLLARTLSLSAHSSSPFLSSAFCLSHPHPHPHPHSLPPLRVCALCGEAERTAVESKAGTGIGMIGRGVGSSAAAVSLASIVGRGQLMDRGIVGCW